MQIADRSYSNAATRDTQQTAAPPPPPKTNPPHHGDSDGSGSTQNATSATGAGNTGTHQVNTVA